MRRTVRTIVIATALMTSAPVVPVLLNFSSLYARVYDDRRFPALSRYALERTPDMVLIGSSMTFRLYESYFKTKLLNISISGGSPLTGLAILASYPSLPRVALVEMNIMSRPVDPELLEKFGRNEDVKFRWFEPYRAAISFVYYWLKYRSENVAELRRSALATYDISASLHQATDEFASTNADNAKA